MSFLEQLESYKEILDKKTVEIRIVEAEKIHEDLQIFINNTDTIEIIETLADLERDLRIADQSWGTKFFTTRALEKIEDDLDHLTKISFLEKELIKRKKLLYLFIRDFTSDEKLKEIKDIILKETDLLDDEYPDTAKYQTGVLFSSNILLPILIKRKIVNGYYELIDELKEMNAMSVLNGGE